MKPQRNADAADRPFRIRGWDLSPSSKGLGTTLFLSIFLLAGGLSMVQAATFCPPYESSPLYRPRARQIAATPSDWISKIESAQSGDEILLADGTYSLDQ